MTAEEHPMKFSRPGLVAVSCLALSIGATTALYASPIALVQGTIFSNPSTIFDTGQQAGSPLSDILAPWNFTCTTQCSGFGISGNGAAHVTNGALGVSSSLTVTGAPPANYSAGADSIANYTDLLTITGGAGGGVLELTYAINGSISEMGMNQSAADIFVLGPTGGYVQRNGGALQLNNGIGLIGEGPHADTVNFFIPFTYGSAFSIEPEMIANAVFFAPPDTTPFTATVAFNNTATLSSALVFAGTPLALGAENFTAGISSTSGLSYGPSGITSPVPEPASIMLLGTGLLLVGRRLRKKAGATRSSVRTPPSL
jgi:hypothetical protein